MRLTEAFEAIEQYFSPLKLQASMASPTSISIVLTSEEDGSAHELSTIPCGPTLTNAELFKIIGLIEQQLKEKGHRSLREEHLKNQR